MAAANASLGDLRTWTHHVLERTATVLTSRWSCLLCHLYRRCFKASNVPVNKGNSDFVPLMWYKSISRVPVVLRCQHITYSEVRRKIPFSCLPLHRSSSSRRAINRRPICSGVILCKERFCGALNKRGIRITNRSDRETASVSRFCFLALFVFCVRFLELSAVRGLMKWMSGHTIYDTCWCKQSNEREFFFSRAQKRMYNKMGSIESCVLLVWRVRIFSWSVSPRSFYLNLWKPTGHVMHQQFNIQQLYALPTLYLCVLYLSENKQRLVPLTA